MALEIEHQGQRQTRVAVATATPETPAIAPLVEPQISKRLVLPELKVIKPTPDLEWLGFKEGEGVSYDQVGKRLVQIADKIGEEIQGGLNGIVVMGRDIVITAGWNTLAKSKYKAGEQQIGNVKIGAGEVNPDIDSETAISEVLEYAIEDVDDSVSTGMYNGKEIVMAVLVLPDSLKGPIPEGAFETISNIDGRPIVIFLKNAIDYL